jgi:predicted small metal-binding protein
MNGLATRGQRLKSFSCGSVVSGCISTFTAVNEDGIPEQVARHAHEDHGLPEVPAELVDEFDRPVAIVPRGGIRTRRRVSPMPVMATDRLTDVVRRLCGLIPLERLLERLADAVDGGPRAAADRRSA